MKAHDNPHSHFVRCPPRGRASTFGRPGGAGMTPEQRKNNLRLALILASVAVTFFVGFFAKIALFSH